MTSIPGQEISQHVFNVLQSQHGLLYPSLAHLLQPKVQAQRLALHAYSNLWLNAGDQTISRPSFLRGRLRTGLPVAA